MTCHSDTAPGYHCPDCGTYSPLSVRTDGNKGSHGQAVDLPVIQQAIEALTDLRTRRAAKAVARAQADRHYTEQAAMHTQHPQTRGNRRKMLSRP